MLKRIMLAVTFAAALGVGGLGLTSSASAYGGCHRGGFHGPPAAYRYYGYGPRYYGYYGPRYYGRAYYPAYYGGYGGYGGAYIPFGHRGGGVYFGIGF